MNKGTQKSFGIFASLFLALGMVSLVGAVSVPASAAVVSPGDVRVLPKGTNHEIQAPRNQMFQPAGPHHLLVTFDYDVQNILDAVGGIQNIEMISEFDLCAAKVGNSSCMTLLNGNEFYLEDLLKSKGSQKIDVGGVDIPLDLLIKLLGAKLKLGRVLKPADFALDLPSRKAQSLQIFGIFGQDHSPSQAPVSVTMPAPLEMDVATFDQATQKINLKWKPVDVAGFSPKYFNRELFLVTQVEGGAESQTAATWSGGALSLTPASFGKSHCYWLKAVATVKNDEVVRDFFQGEGRLSQSDIVKVDALLDNLGAGLRFNEIIQNFLPSNTSESYSSFIMDQTQPVCVTPTRVAVAAPSELKASVIDVAQRKVRLTWKDNSSNEARFEVSTILSNGSFHKEMDVNANINQLEANFFVGETCFSIRAMHVSGIEELHSAYSPSTRSVCVNIQERLSAPTDLTATSAPSGQLAILKWTDRSNGERGFLIEEKVSGVWKKVSEVEANFSTASLQTSAGSHCYRIKAVQGSDAALDSEFSAGAACVDIRLRGVSNFATQTLSNGKIKLTWTDTSQGETGFKLLYKQNGRLLAFPLIKANSSEVLVNVEAGEACFALQTMHSDSRLSSDIPPYLCQVIAFSKPQISKIKREFMKLTFSWSDTFKGESSYVIYEVTDKGKVLRQMTTASANQTSAVWKGIVGLRKECYAIQVLGANPRMNSPLSQPVCIQN